MSYDINDIVEVPAKVYFKAFSIAYNEMGDEKLQVYFPELSEVEEMEKNGAKFFLSIDTLSGSYVKSDGYMGGLWKSPQAKKGAAHAHQQKRINEGGFWFDCFDTFLTDIYQKNGFRIAARLNFNPEYAPHNWQNNEHLRNKPDVIFMTYRPDLAMYAGGHNAYYIEKWEDGARVASWWK